MVGEEVYLYGLLVLLLLLIMFSLIYYNRRFASINIIVAGIYTLPMLYGYLHAQEYLIRDNWRQYLYAFSISHIGLILIVLLSKYFKQDSIAGILYKLSKLIAVLAAIWSMPFILITGTKFLESKSLGVVSNRFFLFGMYELFCLLMYLLAITRKYLPIGWAIVFLILQVGAMTIFRTGYIILDVGVMITVFSLQIPKKKQAYSLLKI